MNKTKIIATIGPSSLSLNILKKMHRTGMSGVRINTARALKHSISVLARALQKAKVLSQTQ